MITTPHRGITFLVLRYVVGGGISHLSFLSEQCLSNIQHDDKINQWQHSSTSETADRSISGQLLEDSSPYSPSKDATTSDTLHRT